VLKPTILGGALRSMRIASLARARNLGVIVTHALDGPVATTAAIAIAHAISADAAGIDAHDGLAAFPTIDGFDLGDGPPPLSFRPSVLPGLGLHVSDTTLGALGAPVFERTFA
jgi:L-alanine-DL-glutamate epimerase-like enolase superfamily enzyme